MSEIEQLESLLLPSAYWEDNRPGSYTVDASNGIELRVLKEEDRIRWETIWADRTSGVSDRAFRSVEDAKRDLQKVLKIRLEKLIDDKARRRRE